ncbi:ribosome maturation factor RimM [Asanoa ishikariensis]|uniref:Ribosome maturation factor RimM n=1 Tax=Asanoa ishikariensis TaxID=137265 RepID=A0A1H3RK43_9ACTN|nr:ribosome maturation factor RimM [Asanoa ishikariensis]GIF67122.1 ribosome maturation factor RimM [Asanoa ishikariensis]SDZ26077.1 16S rRNA processing protein RimM [Asanoa ishikariensis]
MLLVVGRIGRPHGIRGEVTVEVRTDEPEQRFAAGSVLRTDPAAASVSSIVPDTLTIEEVRFHQGRPLVLFDGYYERDLVENLRNVLLVVDSSEISVPDDPDEFLDHQLVGLSAVSPGGEVLGTVTRIEHAPSSDLLVLSRPDGRSALVPFVKEIVPAVDLAGGRVVVDAPAGLLDL